MMRQTVVLLSLAACVFAASLPVRPLGSSPHARRARRSSRSQGRIVGGQDAAQGQFPYQVSLQWVVLGIASHTCGGSILSASAILTAGHCIQDDLGHYQVVAGEHDLWVDEGTEQTVRVSQQIAHPDYRPVGDVAINDVAVFTLESPLTLNSWVQAISLPVANSVPAAGSAAVMSGWGATRDGILPHMPRVLQYADVFIVSNPECAQVLGDSALNDGNVCTGPYSGGVSACSGDSGGPLAQDGAVIGIASWAILPCGAKGGPSVFTRVAAYEDFITQFI